MQRSANGGNRVPFSPLTLARAFLQLVHALGVTESGTFLLLPVTLESPGLTRPDDVDSGPAILDDSDNNI